MNNFSIKHKAYLIFFILFAALTAFAVITFKYIELSKEDAEILNAMGRQRMLTQAMGKHALGYVVAKSRIKTIERQILSLNEYITQMRKTYTETVVGLSQKNDINFSMEGFDSSHSSLPFPATFTRMINKRFGENSGLKVDIISELPVNPEKSLKTDLDKEANGYLKNRKNKFFSKVAEENDKIEVLLYLADRATTQACINCHSQIQGKPFKLGDVLGIRRYKLFYSDNVLVGNYELNANLNEYEISKKAFVTTLSAIKSGGEYPLDIAMKQMKKIKAVEAPGIKESIKGIEKKFSEFQDAVLLVNRTNNNEYQGEQFKIISLSGELLKRSNILVNQYFKIANDHRQQIRDVVIFSGLFTLLLFLIMAIYLSKSVINPIQAISSILSDVAKGKLDRRSEQFNTKDEISVLQKSCNLLIQGLQNFIRHSEQIITGKESKERFELGGEFQKSLNRISAQADKKKEAEEKLVEYREHLEKTVARRTSEYLETNNELLEEISKRKQIEKNLLEKEKHLAMVLDNTIDGIITMGEDGLVRIFNSKAEKIFGYSKSEIIGQRVETLMTETDAKEHANYVKSYIESGITKIIGIGREVTGKRKDGSTFPIELGVGELWIGDDRVFIGSVRDISEIKEMQAQLNHSQKMESIGQMAAGIAHEMNTPLQYIGDNALFLKDSFSDLLPIIKECERVLGEGDGGSISKDQISQLKEMVKEGDLDFLFEEIPSAIDQSLEGVSRVSKIVQAMKEFSHPGTEDKTPFNINEAISTTLEVSRNEWKYYADVDAELDPNLPLVPVFTNDFNQIILNIVVNAAHSIREKMEEEKGDKGTIHITTRQAGQWAEIRIRDTGKGIPENIRRKIFNPFFTTKEVGKGTGQGLSIVHAMVVKKHEGKIHFETALGKGTTFIIRLPLYATKDNERNE